MRSPTVFLAGERLYLRPLVDDDTAGNYVNWLNDEEVCKYNSHHVFPYSAQSALEYIRNCAANRNLVLAIIQRTDNRHIGNISLQDIHQIYRSADLAFLLGERDCWGKGYAGEAGKLVINHGFNALNLQRITCGTSDENIPMQKLAEALGFSREGVRRRAMFKNGRYVDVIEYGLLKEEWQKRC